MGLSLIHICGAARRRVVWRLVRLRTEGRQARLPAAELLPPERRGRGSVRAHAHHRRGRRRPALHRGLLGTQVQRLSLIHIYLRMDGPVDEVCKAYRAQFA